METGGYLSQSWPAPALAPALIESFRHAAIDIEFAVVEAVEAECPYCGGFCPGCCQFTLGFGED